MWTFACNKISWNENICNKKNGGHLSVSVLKLHTLDSINCVIKEDFSCSFQLFTLLADLWSPHLKKTRIHPAPSHVLYREWNSSFSAAWKVNYICHGETPWRSYQPYYHHMGSVSTQREEPTQVLLSSRRGNTQHGSCLHPDGTANTGPVFTQREHITQVMSSKTQTGSTSDTLNTKVIRWSRC